MKNPGALTRLGALLVLTMAADPAWADSLQLISAARVQTQGRVTYDGSYRRIPYPMGDVPADRGVCTDVVIRAYRSIGIDLQELVHKDMQGSFNLYPQQWGMKKPDTNIDHRRVPNLRKFLDRAGAKLAVTRSAADFQPGDLVTWMLPGNLPHIGIVSDRKTEDRNRPLIIHNIGAGPKEEDALFAYPITAHYRYRVQ